MPIAVIGSLSKAHAIHSTVVKCNPTTEPILLRDSYTNTVIDPLSSTPITYNGKSYHLYNFTAEKHFYVSAAASCKLLLVGGGGSGGSYQETLEFDANTYYPGLGGGGGGEVVMIPQFELLPSEHYQIQIGQGALTGGMNGTSTTFTPYYDPFLKRIAKGGGGGGSFTEPAGKDGGSGGGAAGNSTQGGNAILTYDGSVSFANPGGARSAVDISSGAGGGGASLPGQGGELQGVGGAGIQWIDGVTYGAGGGGGRYIPPGTLYNLALYDPIPGGQGNGGSGAGLSLSATSGEDFVGAGGGGGNRLFRQGGPGGRGVVRLALEC